MEDIGEYLAYTLTNHHAGQAKRDPVSNEKNLNKQYG